MPDGYLAHLLEEIKSHGVTDWFLDESGKHNKLRFDWNGGKIMHVFPKTPSDQRGVLNSVSDLRRQMNVRRVIRKSEDRGRRRPVAPASPKPPDTITVRPSPFAALADFHKPKEPVRCPRLTLAQIAAMIYAPR